MRITDSNTRKKQPPPYALPLPQNIPVEENTRRNPARMANIRSIYILEDT
jgi:hypothetical protein